MRDFEFRAWVKKHKKFSTSIFSIDFDYKEIDVQGCDHKDCGLCRDTYTFDDVILEQYTGLTDKNGTKIFEGDIAKNDAGILYEVFYSQKLGFTVRRINDKGQFIDGESQWVSVANYHIFIEVIGNIHERGNDE